jgi:hypothetical protein
LVVHVFPSRSGLVIHVSPLWSGMDMEG